MFLMVSGLISSVNYHFIGNITCQTFLTGTFHLYGKNEEHNVFLLSFAQALCSIYCVCDTKSELHLKALRFWLQQDSEEENYSGHSHAPNTFFYFPAPELPSSCFFFCPFQTQRRVPARTERVWPRGRPALLALLPTWPRAPATPLPRLPWRRSRWSCSVPTSGSASTTSARK